VRVTLEREVSKRVGAKVRANQNVLGTGYRVELSLAKTAKMSCATQQRNGGESGGGVSSKFSRAFCGIKKKGGGICPRHRGKYELNRPV